MERKCSCCGGKNLVSVEPPFSYWGDGNFRFTGSVSICMDCAHYEFFGPEAVEKRKKLISDLENLNSQIDEKEKRIKELKERFNLSFYKNEIERLKNEIETLKTLRVSGNDIILRERDIRTNEGYIERGINKEDAKEFTKLNEEIEKLKRSVEVLKQKA